MEAGKSEITRRIKNSLEMQDILRQVMYFGIFIPVLCLSVASVRNIWQFPGGWIPVVLIMAVFTVPFLVFYLVRIIRIFRKVEDYIFDQVALDCPHAFSRGAMYFTVSLKGPDGMVYTVDTHAIFYTRSLFGLQFEECVNHMATVAYNPTTGMVLVIG